MSEQIPTIGRIVQFRLSEQDAVEINRRRTDSRSIADRLKHLVLAGSTPEAADNVYAWPAGAQAHIGNETKAGQTFPMLIVRVWGPTLASCVNGQVFLDGNDVFWALSVSAGEGPHTFSWPPRG